jgi:hypothetical protein
MNKITKNVMAQIKNENIKPVPKWEFVLKEYFIFGLFAFNLIIGSIGFAITLFILSNIDATLNISNTNLLQLLIFSIPFVWILITAIFIFTAYYNFKHTSDGYRYSVVKIFLINIVITFVIGIILTFMGVSEKLNNVFSQNIPYYSNIFDLRSQMWMRPNEGYLAGKITKIDSVNNTIVIHDLNSKEWVVSLKNALVKGRVVIRENEQIKILGKITDSNHFEATEVRPWSGQNMMHLLQ